jgi:hypothetical protein
MKGFLTFLVVDGRIQIREAQKHRDPDPKTADFKSAYWETESGSKHRVVAPPV